MVASQPPNFLNISGFANMLGILELRFGKLSSKAGVMCKEVSYVLADFLYWGEDLSTPLSSDSE